MQSAGRSVKGFDRRTAKMAANVAKAGAAIAAGLAVAAAGMAKMASNAAKTAKEIQNLSNISGIGVEKFQRYSQAARSVGIEQDKLSDIFKDVNDKFGDFLETGAGPLADFFEQIAPAIGVTAEQFAKLSGPEALQLYVSSLEKAGVSQAQMTFYMEALANDATALIPLLRNNGSEMQRLGDEAARSGRILSTEAVNGGAELDDKLRELSDTLKMNLNEAILENSDEIVALTETITEDWIPALVSVAGFIADVVKGLSDMVGWIGSAMGAIVDFGATIGDLENGAPTFFDSDSQAGRLRASGRRPAWEGLDSGYSEAAGESAGLGASVGGLAISDEAMQTEDEAREEALERLEAFRKRQEDIEAAADAARTAGRAKTADELVEIERRTQQARMSHLSGALGDLSTLMTTENKKLFKIGQAAALAQATIDGYAAATSAWKHGMAAGGPPLAVAYTGASLVRTAALISSIASASSTGSSGSAAGGGAVTAGVTDRAPSTYYNVSLQGQGNIGRDDVRGLLEAINEEIANGGNLAGITVS